MATRRDRRAEARRISAAIRAAIGLEILNARRSGGASQAEAGQAVGMSHSQFGRVERAQLPNVTVHQLALGCSAVGLKLVVRAYPDGSPIRDAAHLALIGRFRERVPRSCRVRTEVALPISNDWRAWDLVIECLDGKVAVEAETRLHDIQALERRVALKQRDGSLDRVILLVSDTPANRRTLADHRESLIAAFPLRGREILRAIHEGCVPSASGIIVM